MDEAIKDKTAQVQKEMEDAQMGPGQQIVDQKHEAMDDSDSDFNDDDDSILQGLRAQRMKEMKMAHKEEIENLSKGHGTYREITEEEFLPTVTKTTYCIVHFYHKDFERCKIVDMHLANIVKTHTEALIVKIDAEKSPFFIAKLQVQVLPTIISFIDGVAVDHIVGFEELGGQDDFP